MKRNDFITNVLKCNNFHCLASLRLVDLNRLPTKSLQNALGLASSEASVSKSDAACVQSPKSLLV